MPAGGLDAGSGNRQSGGLAEGFHWTGGLEGSGAHTNVFLRATAKKSLGFAVWSVGVNTCSSYNPPPPHSSRECEVRDDMQRDVHLENLSHNRTRNATVVCRQAVGMFLGRVTLPCLDSFSNLPRTRAYILQNCSPQCPLLSPTS